MTDIHTVKTVLAVAAALLGMTAAVVRGRASPAVLSVASFTLLALLALEINAPRIVSLDASMFDWFYWHRFHRLRINSQDVFYYLGQPIPFAAAGVICGTLLALQARSALRAVVVIGGVAVGVAAEQTLKAVVVRTPATLAALHDGSLVEYAHSFPSGHVTTSATLLGMIAVCLGTGRSPLTKATLAVPAVTGAVFVAFLALHTGAHIFSDVVGGMVLSAAIVAAGTAALRPPKRRQ